ncbi:hypothetical protein DICSQDRAFT_174471 [Dichomitus squalens LYAD-421 SS1]|uniref:Uncharacterized protein n=1 Tax=Dichomitus squalens (strain LYAD-421) TaxID=732165 RepID=R7SL70_DICSQ|nr:uncharacterized protein DICSQDRAFT_174471 [Dichomitus squalens LYAD-421 SS1]EJF56884.1 hypothetical protein DICSQDRAFT_174471 [Dichomitus squalens LYAD-421 SS1]
MNAPACSAPHFASDTYSPTHAYEAYDSPSHASEYALGGYDHPACSSQWTDGTDGYAFTYSETHEQLPSAFFTTEVTSANTAVSSVPIPMPSLPSNDGQTALLYVTQAHSELLWGTRFADWQFPACVESMGHSSPPISLRQALPSRSAPCISPDLVYPTGHAEDDGVPLPNECVPQTTSNISQSTRGAHQASRSSSHSSSSASPSPVAEPHPGTSPRLVASTRRNAQVPSPNAHSSSSLIRTNRWACPHCPYVQHNRRSPDLKRHIETHTHGADVAMWVCCGVYALDALDQGVPVEVVRQGQIMDFDGVPMIGGCMKTFSRKDALIRHLKAQKGKCFGDAWSMYQPGNRLKDGEGLES